MGITTLDVDVANVAKPDVTQRLKFIVDSGATYSIVPRSVLRKLQIRPLSRETLELADGNTIVRQKGVALFKFEGRIGGADVIFGEKGDATLLGVLTLEALALVLDPVKRTLRPMTLTL